MTDQIQTDIIGNLGIITLNRPKALNALTTIMCQAMTQALLQWEQDDKIGAVVVQGAGERAFCAGGDIIMLHDSGKQGGKEAAIFWRTEYALNELIHGYSKPYIALIDGIVMGGGVGLSVHGRHRIAGDNTLFAMPETGIGYFPDVGGTYFLPRLGISTGMWLGLTGARLTTAKACQIGVANSYVPTDRHNDLVKALGAAELDGSDKAVLDVLADFVKTPPSADALPGAIAAFNSDSIAGVFEALERDGSDWARQQHNILKRKSPLALCVTFRALQEGGQMVFRDAMAQELNISMNFLNVQDFYEGVRAQVIDKDRNPKWSHDDVQSVTQGQVERVFRAVKPPLAFLN